MKVSEMIVELEGFIREHGDLEVDMDYFGERRAHRGPRKSWRKVLTPRESKPKFGTGKDGGEPVCMM
jgi:hypothetical protein